MEKKQNNPECLNELAPPIPVDTFGITFVKHSNYPTQISRVSNGDEIASNFAAELDWSMSTLLRYNGYGIALPQVGVPFNVAVMRYSLNCRPAILFNLEYTIDVTKNDGVAGKKSGVRLACFRAPSEVADDALSRMSKEADYSICDGKLYFVIRRAAKIRAEWDSWNLDTKKLTHNVHVMKLPPGVSHVTESAVFQNVADHMQADYIRRLCTKIEATTSAHQLGLIWSSDSSLPFSFASGK